MRVAKIAKKFNLPYWWVESVIIEYFPCRKFLENGELWLFDFNIFDKSLIDTIPQKHVIIPQYYIAQNIKPKDLSQRTLLGAIGSPMVPLKKEDLFSEGVLNNTAFPFLGNPIEVWDPKLTFHSHAVIYDEGLFYQWKIAELDSNFTEKSSWWKSDLFDLIPLWKIYQKLMTYRTQEILSNPTPELREKAKADYEELEKARQPLREKIWEYHKQKKLTYKPDLTTVPEPPRLTVFDAISLVDGRYETRSHLEPVFYRSALRNYKLAKKANDEFKKTDDQSFALAEIEYSLVVIVMASSCLESYINLIIKEHASQYKDLKNHKKQWLLVGKSLNPNNPFEEDKKPYSDFAKVVDWRNAAMHYVAEFQPTVGEHTLVYNNFRVENAKIAIDVVKPMIERLSENTTIPLPRWIEKPQSEGGYWDDAFKD